MATGIVITVAEKLFAVLHSQELREICSMFGYESQLDDLKVTVSAIKCVLLDAESKHQELSHEGGDYIERLKEAVYDVDDLLDEFTTTVQKNRHLKGGKISKKRKQETMSFVGEDSIIGREGDKEAIVDMLLGDSESSNDTGHNASFITIVGENRSCATGV